jgi:hypothetical protein
MIISDSNEIRIINITTLATVWHYASDLYSIYNVENLPDGNILLSSDFSRVVEEISLNGTVIWQYGILFTQNILWFNILYGMGLESLFLVSVLWGVGAGNKKIATTIILVGLLTIGVIFLAISPNIMANIFDTVAR